MKADRDIEKTYPLPEFVEKLRRLADSLETGQRFEIEIAGERYRFLFARRTISNTNDKTARKRSSSR